MKALILGGRVHSVLIQIIVYIHVSYNYCDKKNHQMTKKQTDKDKPLVAD